MNANLDNLQLDKIYNHVFKSTDQYLWLLYIQDLPVRHCLMFFPCLHHQALSHVFPHDLTVRHCLMFFPCLHHQALSHVFPHDLTVRLCHMLHCFHLTPFFVAFCIFYTIQGNSLFTLLSSSQTLFHILFHSPYVGLYSMFSSIPPMINPVPHLVPIHDSIPCLSPCPQLHP